MLIITALVMLSCGIFMAFDAGAATETLYVKAGGTGNGLSEDDAFGDILDAVNAATALEEDCDVVIVGEVGFNFSQSYEEPEHTNKITIRGKNDDSKLKVVTDGKVWKLGGELEIKNIDIEITKNSQFVFTTQFYKMTFGEGIDVTNTSGVAESKGLLCVRTVGGDTTRNYDSTDKVYRGDSTIIIKSGRFEDVSAFAHNGAKGNLDGTCRLYVGQDAVINNLTVCRNAKYTATNAEIYIDGATIRRHAAVNDCSVSGLGSKLSGVTDTFKLVITKNTDVNGGWDHTSPASTLFVGISGCAASKDNAETHLDRASFILEIEDGVYDAVTTSSKVRPSTFDEVKKIADGTGVPADILGTYTPDDTTELPETSAPETDAPETDAPVVDAPKVLYVKADGVGDGMSEENAFGNILDAVNAAANETDDVFVVISGVVDFNFSASYKEPEHSNKITIMGKDADSKLRVATAGKVWTIGGEFEMKELNLEITKDSQLIFTTQFYHTAFGEGLNVTNTSGAAETKGLISVRAVDSNTTRFFDAESKTYSANSTIIIKSGRFEDVSAFAHNGSKGNLEGTCRVYVGADAVINNLTVCRNAKYTATNAEIYIDGATVRRHAAVNDCSASGLGSKLSGVSSTFKLVITKNSNINDGWDHASPASTLFNGISGCIASKDSAEKYLDRAYFVLMVEESVYDITTESSKIRLSTFDEVKKIADGSGVSADIFDVNAPYVPIEPPVSEGPETGDDEVDTPVTENSYTKYGTPLFVKAGGMGDGTSEDNAFGNILDAVNAAAAEKDDVCVVIVGVVEFNFSEAYNEPTHKNKITIMGKDADSKLRVITAGKVWTIGGEFEMRELNIEITKNSSFVFTTQFYYTTFGEGLNVTNTSGTKEGKTITVRTVDTNTTRKYDSKKKVYTGASTIILKSGKYEDVSAFAHNGAKGNLNGTCRLYIGPDAIVNNLTVCRNVNKTATNAEIIIDGGIVRRVSAVTDRNITTLGTTKKSGVTGTYKLIITKNTDINLGWDHASPVATYFQGFSGCSPSVENAESHLGRANFILEIEESVYDAVIASDNIRLSTFDSVKKIADGTGVPDTLFDSAQNPDTSDNTMMVVYVMAMSVVISAAVISLKKRKA